jgi:hypothetical protein
MSLTSRNREPASAEFAEVHSVYLRPEWKEHHRILPEHANEFSQYFDIVDLTSLTTPACANLMREWALELLFPQ